MKFRFTIKQLESISNDKLLYCLIEERKSELNIYSPLYKRLYKLQTEKKLTHKEVTSNED